MRKPDDHESSLTLLKRRVHQLSDVNDVLALLLKSNLPGTKGAILVLLAAKYYIEEKKKNEDILHRKAAVELVILFLASIQLHNALVFQKYLENLIKELSEQIRKQEASILILRVDLEKAERELVLANKEAAEARNEYLDKVLSNFQKPHEVEVNGKKYDYHVFIVPAVQRPIDRHRNEKTSSTEFEVELKAAVAIGDNEFELSLPLEDRRECHRSKYIRQDQVLHNNTQGDDTQRVLNKYVSKKEIKVDREANVKKIKTVVLGAEETLVGYQKKFEDLKAILHTIKSSSLEDQAKIQAEFLAKEKELLNKIKTPANDNPIAEDRIIHAQAISGDGLEEKRPIDSHQLSREENLSLYSEQSTVRTLATLSLNSKKNGEASSVEYVPNTNFEKVDVKLAPANANSFGGGAGPVLGVGVGSSAKPAEKKHEGNSFFGDKNLGVSLKRKDEGKAARRLARKNKIAERKQRSYDDDEVKAAPSELKAADVVGEKDKAGKVDEVKDNKQPAPPGGPTVNPAPMPGK